MQSHHAVWTGHSNQRAEIDAGMFEPERAVETGMDQAPMHADGVSETQRDRAGRDQEDERAPRKTDRSEDEADRSHCYEPERFWRRPLHVSVERIGVVVGKNPV